LLICETFLLQTLDEFERVEMVILPLRRGGAEVATNLEGRSIASSKAPELFLML
jgi:hypothetical protein